MHSLTATPPDAEPLSSPALAGAPQPIGVPRCPAPGRDEPSGTDLPAGSGTVLTPADEFPDALEELSLTELQVLHSRVTCQLEREYLAPGGPHPLTVDRQHDAVAELTRRGSARRS